MKAHKIELSNYEIEVLDKEGNYIKVPYDVRRSICDLLMAPQLKLNGTALLKNYSIAQKILEAKDSFVLLENHDYGVLRQAIESLDVFGKHEVQLIQWIVEAKEVEVTEK